MVGQAQIAYLEADVAYRRQRMLNEFVRIRRTPRPVHPRWLQRAIDAVTRRRRNDPRRGAIRWEGDGPIVRPAGAPHHATSH